MYSREKLDQFALDIELLLISVIQGVALATLGAVSINPLVESAFEYWPYIFTAFVFILIFWSGAISHAVSFIRWPLDLNHSFLYFLASLIEVMAISSVTKPALWFVFLFSFQIVALALYTYDLWLIKNCEKDFNRTQSGRKLYAHILHEQLMELKFFVPASLVFNLAAILAMHSHPAIFIGQKYHLIFILLQALFGLAFLIHSLSTFKVRSRLLLNK